MEQSSGIANVRSSLSQQPVKGIVLKLIKCSTKRWYIIGSYDTSPVLRNSCSKDTEVQTIGSKHAEGIPGRQTIFKKEAAS